jgi:predicted TPR repeat methyltransferase
VGIDISSRMLRFAEKSNLYDDVKLETSWLVAALLAS